MPARSSKSGKSQKATDKTTNTAGAAGNGVDPSQTTPQEDGPRWGSLHFFSCGISLPDEAVKACRDADLIIASRRLLKELGKAMGKGGLAGKATLVLDAQAGERMNDAGEAAANGKKVVVLASGDALFHGIGSTFVKSLGSEVEFTLCPENLEMDEKLRFYSHHHMAQNVGTIMGPDLPFDLVFHTGPTVAQVLCHKLGIPLDNASFFCCHSKEEHEIPAGEISRCPNLSIIYTGQPCTPKVVATRLLQYELSQDMRLVLVASELGTPQEQLVFATLSGVALGNFPPTSVLLLFPDGRRSGLPLPLATPDEDYLCDKHVITNRWIRSALLGALELVPGGILWDLGAGSGSVGIEASVICPNLTVHAVEKKQRRCAHIAKNVRTLGVVNHHLHKGNILRLLPKLAEYGEPQSVFIGGGGKDVPLILHWLLETYSRKMVNVVVVAVTLDTLALLSQFSRQFLEDMFTLSVEEGRTLENHDLLPEPGHRVHVFRYLT